MRRRVLLIAVLITALALAVPTAAIYFAAFTQSGLQFIVNRVPARIGGVRLTFVNVRGTLAGGVRIERLVIDQERVYLRFEDVRARIDLRSLLWQTIHSREAFAHTVFVQVKRHKEEPPSRDPHFLPHGLVIRVDSVHADAATLILPNGQRMDGTQLATAGFIRRHTIH